MFPPSIPSQDQVDTVSVVKRRGTLRCLLVTPPLTGNSRSDDDPPNRGVDSHKVFVWVSLPVVCQ